MNKAPSIVLFCLPFLLALGCAQPPSPQGRAQLTLARRQFDSHRFPMAIQTLTSFLNREFNSTAAADAYYRRGLCHYRLARATQAEHDFQQALRRTRDPRLRAATHIAFGHLYFEPPCNNPGQAIVHYTAALPLLDPNVPPTDHVLYRLAAAQQMIGQWRLADLHFSRCFNTFDQSPWAEKARTRFGARTWRIQLGALDDLEPTLARIDQLKRDGWLADWTPLPTQGRLRYVVRTGRFPTYAHAAAVLAQLTPLQPEAWITTAQNGTMPP